MANKKELTVEELTKACTEAKESWEALCEQLNKVKQEEEDRKRAQLALEKESRKKAVDDAYEHYNKLLKDYIKDYGAYAMTLDPDDGWFPNKFFRDFF